MLTALILAHAVLSLTTPHDEPSIEEGVYDFRIAEQTMGREEIWFTADGWSSIGNFDIPGAVPKTTYEARFTTASDGVGQWTLDVNTRGTDAVIEATLEDRVCEGTIAPFDATFRCEAKGEHPTMIFENLVWGSFSELCRTMAAHANEGALQVGFRMTAVMPQAEQTFDFELKGFEPHPHVIDGQPVSLWFFDLVSIADQVMHILATPDGIPLVLEVPSQQLRVTMEGHESLRMPGSEPVTIVDRGAWRDLLSQPVHDVQVEKGVKIPMRDEVNLAADLYRPAGDDKVPTILVRTPYGRGTEGITKGAFYARRGYALIVQDVRGRFDSEGDWYPFRHDFDDGSDTIDWIAAQPWSDGNVGMIGASYVGWVQWAAARTGNPHLKAIVPQVSPPDPDQNFPYEGGAFLMAAGWWATYLDNIEAGAGLPDVDFDQVLRTLPLNDIDTALGTRQTFLDDWVSHPPVDPFWDEFRYQDRFGDMNVAALNITGWFDGDMPGALMNFPAMREQGGTEFARQNQFLIVGPWSHAFNTSRNVGAVDFGDEAVVDLNSVYIRFFDHYLRGVDNGFADEDPVLQFVMGENTWSREKDWPLPATQFTPLYLDSDGDATKRVSGDGRLSLATADGEPAFDEYQFDPLNLPETDTNFNDFEGEQSTSDLSDDEDRDDDLDYQSAPLAQDCVITGPVQVVLYVSTEAADADFGAALLRKTPDGQLFGVAGGIQRMRYRNLKDEPVPPNEMVKIVIDCWATSIRLSKGDRLHLTITSHLFPGYARNLGTLENPATAIEGVVATRRVYHTPDSASHVLLPVVPRDGAPGIEFADG